MIVLFFRRFTRYVSGTMAFQLEIILFPFNFDSRVFFLVFVKKKLLSTASKPKNKAPKKKDDVVSVSTTYDITCWIDSTLLLREEFRVCEWFTKTAQPIHLEKSKDIFMSGVIHMSVDLERDVLFIGETFPIKIKVDNQSRRNVDSFIVKLIGIASVQVGDKYKTGMYEEHRTEYEGMPHKSTCERLLHFTVSPTIWPSSTGKVSRYQYQLYVTCDIKQAFALEFYFVDLFRFFDTN